MIRFIVVYKS